MGQPGNKRLADSLWCRRSTTDWFWTIHEHIKCKQAMLTYLNSLQSRRLCARLSIMYKGLKPPYRKRDWQPSQIPASKADYEKFSSYPWTTADWNALPEDPPWEPSRSQLVPSPSDPQPPGNTLFQHSTPADFTNTSNAVLFILCCTSPLKC